jgi:hypothetical protein
VESSPILFGEPIARVEVQEFDFRALWQIGRFVNDKPSGLHSSFQRHMTTVAPAPFGNKMRYLRAVEHRGRRPVCHANSAA